MTDKPDKPDNDVVDVVVGLNESYSEAEVVQWLVRSGDFVEAEQPIVELSLDKLDIELHAPASGVFVLNTSEHILQRDQVVGRIEPAPPVDRAHVARHLELLAAVANAPKSIEARRAYAEFLRASQSPLPPWGAATVARRGEYLEIVLRLARPTPDDDVAALTKRRKQLEPLAVDTARSLVPYGYGGDVEDGFVVGLTLPLERFVTSYAQIVERAPLRSLVLRDLRAPAIELLQDVPRLEHLRSLRLIPDNRLGIPSELRARIVGAPAFSAVEQVSFTRE